MLRARIGVITEALIELGEFDKDGVVYKVHDATKFSHPDESDQVSDNHRVIDLVFERPSDDIGVCYTHSLNLIDSLFDSISYVGYSKVILNSYFSLCPLETSVGDQFEILVPQYTMGKQQNPVSLDSIKNVNISDSNKNALRLLRQALNSSSSEERYIALYSGLEWFAQQRATQEIINICENCGYQNQTGRMATGNYLVSLFKKYGKTKKESKTFASYRGRIAHGSGTRDREYLAKVTEYASYLEEILIQEVDELVKTTQANDSNAIVSSTPYFIHTCLHESDDSFQLISSNWIAPIKFTKIANRKHKGSISVGAPLGRGQIPVISPIAWPNYQNT